jgi:xanthine/uracil/vitamin C permease (AzgA family)
MAYITVVNPAILSTEVSGMTFGAVFTATIIAADEMVDSRWYRQVTNRANRLVERIRALA